jgi:hypothetical protein
MVFFSQKWNKKAPHYRNTRFFVNPSVKGLAIRGNKGKKAKNTHFWPIFRNISSSSSRNWLKICTNDTWAVFTMVWFCCGFGRGLAVVCGVVWCGLEIFWLSNHSQTTAKPQPNHRRPCGLAVV